MKKAPRSSFRAWLQLLRPPNLFTVPGDPLVGYLLSNSGITDLTLIAAIVSSLFLYGAGLVMNDLADRAEDARERPSRPLPSGAVGSGQAWATMIGLAAAGLVAAWFTQSMASVLCAVGLLFAITLYNVWAKRIPVFGPFVMGLCRGLSVTLGALAGPLAIYKFALIPATCFGLYIAAVTYLAQHETREKAPVLARVLPSILLILGTVGGLIFALGAPARQGAILFFVLAIISVIYLAARMFQTPPPPLPPLIGAHIRILLPLQAANCWLADPWVLGPVVAVVLVALWPLSWTVSKKFYAS